MLSSPIRKTRAEAKPEAVVLVDPAHEEMVLKAEEAMERNQKSLDTLALRQAHVPRGDLEHAKAKYAYNNALGVLMSTYAIFNLKHRSRELHCCTMPQGWTRKKEFTLNEARQLVKFFSARVEQEKNGGGDWSDELSLENAQHDLEQAEEILAPLEAADRIF